MFNKMGKKNTMLTSDKDSMTDSQQSRKEEHKFSGKVEKAVRSFTAPTVFLKTEHKNP